MLHLKLSGVRLGGAEIITINSVMTASQLWWYSLFKLEVWRHIQDAMNARDFYTYIIIGIQTL